MSMVCVGIAASVLTQQANVGTCIGPAVKLENVFHFFKRR